MTGYEHDEVDGSRTAGAGWREGSRHEREKEGWKKVGKRDSREIRELNEAVVLSTTAIEPLLHYESRIRVKW